MHKFPANDIQSGILEEEVKAKQLEIKCDPVDGRIIAAHRRNGSLTKIRDITDDVLLCLCADLAFEDATDEVERTIKFDDGMECQIIAKMVKVGDKGFLKENV